MLDWWPFPLVAGMQELLLLLVPGAAQRRVKGIHLHFHILVLPLLPKCYRIYLLQDSDCCMNMYMGLVIRDYGRFARCTL